MPKKRKPLPDREVTAADEARLRAFLQVNGKLVEEAFGARKKSRKKKS